MNPMNPFINRTLTTGRIIPAANTGRTQGDVPGANPKPDAFSRVLEQELQKGEGVKFSKHAEQRLAVRNISLSRDELDKVDQAVQQARSKGVRDSLIVMKDVAFIVNIPNNIVVTAVQGDEMKQNVYTHIDGAVII